MGKRMTQPPRVFNVNWFRTDENGKFLWPGFGENLRVIEWILDRCRGEGDAVKTPIGYVPPPTASTIAEFREPRKLLVEPADWQHEAIEARHFPHSRAAAARHREEHRLRGRLDPPLAAELNAVLAAARTRTSGHALESAGDLLPRAFVGAAEAAGKGNGTTPPSVLLKSTAADVPPSVMLPTS
jgi:hypothetical protein